MSIVGRAIAPLMIPQSSELYLIRNGIVQNGFTFTAAGKRYNTSGEVTPTVTYNATDHCLEVLAYTSSTRKGSIYYSNSLESIISNYTTLHVKCKRILKDNSNAAITIGTYVEAGSTTYATSNFKDRVSKSRTSDSEMVQLDIPLTSASVVSDVCVAFAFSVPSTGSTYGCYIYDVWFS